VGVLPAMWLGYINLMRAPRLETPRFSLAPLSIDRFDEHFENMSGPRMIQFIGDGKPHQRIEAWRRFCLGAGLWALLSYIHGC
jgi:hypothetical protein